MKIVIVRKQEITVLGRVGARCASLCRTKQ
ncbi:methanobactin [Chitinivorax tropicus]|nr:methanobactin [Chitinivorax tropicus]